VLCNRFGAFVVSHLSDPNEVAFIALQDPGSNPHVSIGRLEKEFGFSAPQLEERLGCVSGDRMLWGSDAVMEILSWCYWPFPAASAGKLVPFPVRNAIYLAVSQNRYRFFGTQPLADNFAKQLCPYLYLKKSGFVGKQVPAPQPHEEQRQVVPE
jgi:predicted DCC family thiol-disulfide oxidoreductase YuxK